MKALTLHQPWASLIARGVKTIETRSWRPPGSLIGERIAIHAGKQVVGLRFLNGDTIGAIAQLYGPDWQKNIPTGAVVATAVLVRAVQVYGLDEQDARNVVLAGGPPTEYVTWDPYGDFSAGRWLWFLDSVERIEPPIAAVGHQRLWEWNSS